MTTRVCARVIATAAILISAACSSEKPTRVAPRRHETPTRTVETSPEQQSAAADADTAPAKAGFTPIGAPGPVYFWVDGAGLVKLDTTGSFSVISDDLEMIKDFSHAGDTLYLASARGVYAVKDDAVKQIGDFEDPGLVDAVAADAQGHIWAISFKGVSHFDGKKWTTREKKSLGADVRILADVAVSEDGAVWVASSNGLHRKTENGFATIPLPDKENTFYFRHFSTSPRGALHVSHRSGVFKLVDGRAEVLDLPEPIGDGVRIAVGPDDSVNIAVADSVVRARGGHVETYSAESGRFKAKRILDLAVDGRGRTWAATDHGVVIIDPSGEITQWEPGTLPALKGTVRALTVIGTGPELPELGPQKFGGVTGKIVSDGKPQARVEVEICALPSMEFTKTPCSDASFKASAKTGPKGKFTFEKVPLGTYRFAIKAGDKWTVTLPPCCSEMKAAELFDVGSIDLSK